MGNFVAKLRFTWEYWVKGMHRAPEPLPDQSGYDPPNESLMKVLGGMYQGHGSEVCRAGPWLAIDAAKLLTRVSYFEHGGSSTMRAVQMDVVTVVTESNHHLIESVGGFGDNLEEALRDALRNFAESSFHPLLCGLLDKACDQVEVEYWTIGGIRRKITMGGLCCRGFRVPSEAWSPIFEAIESRLTTFDLPSGLHWMRYYYAWLPGGEALAEVLLDNETELELQEHLAGLPWPQSESFYSRRLFFTIQDA